MCTFATRAAVMAALFAATACSDRLGPSEPGRDHPRGFASSREAALQGPSRQQATNERLARRFAIALRDDAFRAMVARSLKASTVREGKVHLQGFLDADRGVMRHRLAELANEPQIVIDADLNGSPAIEIYLPVPEHRLRWRGDSNVLVATAERDRDSPVAFNPAGERLLLDPDYPPDTPVIALGRAETTFNQPGIASLECETCFEDPGAGGSGTGGGGTGGTTSLVNAGLYMTYAKFDQTFEGWLKGDPEFEVHMLGQDGSSSVMKSYQCAGEKAGVPYQFDQNTTVWSGSVLLFSQSQLDAYKAQHPNQAIRVFIVEDDDGACVIKTDSARVERLFQQIVSTYGDLTGGKDSTIVSVKTFKKAFSLLKLLKSFWSVITTQDDVVGTAIEDAVAGESAPNANWIVKGENTITHGAIRLEMR
jgi:hypothetical protein